MARLAGFCGFKAATIGSRVDLLQMQLIRTKLRSMVSRRLLALVIVAGVVTPIIGHADETHFVLTIKDRKFDVGEIAVPANVRFTLTVRNLDSVPAEFESNDLNREKVVVGGGSITVYLGPLAPGRYVFFDDFNPKARGAIVAK